MRKRSVGPGSRTTAAEREGTRRALYVTRRIGTALREARLALRLTQREAADRAGIVQAHWSRIERGTLPGVCLDTLASCAAAVRVQLAAFIEAMPGAELPRDIEHLRRQALVIEAGARGGWAAVPEAAIPGDGPRPRSIDVLLERAPRREAAVAEVWDLVTDGGSVMRGLEAKVAATRERLGPEWHVEGLLVVRGTRRNRQLVRQLAPVFAARYPGSSYAWLSALTSSGAPMPGAGGFVWTDVQGTRLIAAHLGGRVEDA